MVKNLFLGFIYGRCVQDLGTYSPQYADLRLLAIPTSCTRVAECNPDYDRFCEIGIYDDLYTELVADTFDEFLEKATFQRQWDFK